MVFPFWEQTGWLWCMVDKAWYFLIRHCLVIYVFHILYDQWSYLLTEIFFTPIKVFESSRLWFSELAKPFKLRPRFKLREHSYESRFPTLFSLLSFSFAFALKTQHERAFLSLLYTFYTNCQKFKTMLNPTTQRPVRIGCYSAFCKTLPRARLVFMMINFLIWFFW